MSEIVAALSDHPLVTGSSDLPPAARANLPSGLAGLAVAFAYLADFDPARAQEHRSTAARLLEEAVDIVVEHTMKPGLHTGFLGVAWALHHLQERLYPGEEDAVEDIDDALLELISVPTWRGHYDLVLGLVGFAVYALERFPREKARRALEELVRLFAEMAEETAEGVTWFTPPHLLSPDEMRHTPDGFYNLGLAHGVPGVIGALAQIRARGVEEATSSRLLEGAVRWQLAQRSNHPQSQFAYLAGVTPEQTPRAAWCYGDPGVSIALLLAADLQGRSDWRREATELARIVAGRDMERCGVVDGGLCHGSAGLGHLLNRLYQATGDEELGAAARRWFAHALDHRDPDAGLAGYPFRRSTPEGEVELLDEPGILTGASGVGLALMAACSTIEPAWDRSVLMSPVPLPTGGSNCP